MQTRGFDAVVVTVPLHTVVFAARLIAGIIIDALDSAFLVFVGMVNLDISFRSSRLSTTGPRSVVFRQANIDEEFARWAAAPERYFSSLTGTTPRTGFEGPQGGLFPEAPPGEGRAQAVDQVPREASSLKLLREKVNPQKSSQDSRCGNPTQR